MLRIRLLLTAALVSFLGGCATSPSSIVEGPTSAAPAPVVAEPALPGSIYVASQHRPLFEGYRARRVGDLLTLVISEKAAVDKKSANTSTREGDANIGIGQFFTTPLATLGRLGVNGESEINSANKDQGSASSTFSTRLGVSVVEVLPNGNLRVAGEKQLGLDRGTEFIRFSGLVSPQAIGPGNVILSSSVADARIEYRTNTQIDRAVLTNFLNRFFFSLLLL